MGKQHSAGLGLRRIAAIDRAESLLAALSYHGVLERGFALVRDQHGQPLHNAAHVSSGQRLNIEFADGRVGATADGDGTSATKPEIAPAKPAPAKPASKRTTDFGVKKVQGDLF